MRTWLLVLFPLGLLAIAACSPKEAFIPQLPPETTIFVQGPVDTVHHRVHLYWFGSDPDGDVRFFEFRMLNPDSLVDSAWVATTAADSEFFVYTPDGYTDPVFEVRAVDDDGLRDPTPARQQFQFRNDAPVVTIGSYPVLSDTTYNSLTLSWIGIDPDGDAARLTYRVWLSGNEAGARTTTARTYTVPSADFAVGPAADSSVRRIYVQAIDEGGMAGAPAVRSWVVRPLTIGGGPPRLLIVDDLPSTGGASAQNHRSDTLWVNGAVRNLPAGTWSILRLEFTRPFRSPKDVEQTLANYDGVIWYRGINEEFTTILRDGQDGIGGALDAGTSVVIEGVFLFENDLGMPGPLRPDFLSRYFDTDYMYKHFSAGMQDSSISWAAPLGGVFRSGPAIPTDSLRLQFIPSGLHGFAVPDSDLVLLWARAGTLTQLHDFDIPVAIAVPQASGATAALVTVPIAPGSVPGPGGTFPQRATAFVNNVFVHVLGLVP